MDYHKFKEALKNESVYPLTDKICEFIITCGKHLVYNKNDVIIPYDKFDDNIYFITDGIVRGSTINSDGRERTSGFGLCGTMIYSAHCGVIGLPSVHEFSACCRTSVLKLSKETFARQVHEDSDFCKWITGMFALTICYNEIRHEGMSGNAMSRYQWLLKTRPEIIEMVSDKVIASYLNITEVHLSRIKSSLSQ